jgi:hypothetical protein
MKKNALSIDHIILNTPDFEDSKTLELFELTKSVKRDGYYSKKQAINILRWKSSRPLRFYDQNSDTDFKRVTKLALEQRNENLRIHILTALHGIKYPAASALLMFYDKSKYPIIDIRVWKQLLSAGLVTGNPSGQNFTLSQWGQFLTVIRELSLKHNIDARQVEKRIFDFDREHQIGPLYKQSKKKK